MGWAGHCCLHLGSCPGCKPQRPGGAGRGCCSWTPESHRDPWRVLPSAAGRRSGFIKELHDAVLPSQIMPFHRLLSCFLPMEIGLYSSACWVLNRGCREEQKGCTR